ncbi:MAG TPA: hypothetical protein VKY73_01755 [Polyangiaceae bacterium]|nr:hypothetical protein [Polyangiaceae bacterium]
MTEQAAPRTILSLPGFAFRGSRLFPGVYAWATTVASPAFARDASVLTRLAAVAALLGLFAGVYWLGRVPRLGRVLGIHGFIGLAMATWVSARHDGIQLAPEPLVAAFGALGWMIYAFGWGELRGPLTVPEDDPRVIPGAPLASRGALGRRATLAFSLGLVGALSFVVLAFRVARPTHAILAHAVALAAGLWVLGAATRVALERAPRPRGSNADRVAAASGTLSALLIVLGLGMLWLLIGN